MDLDFHDKIPKNFPQNSRVWVYQSSRQFTVPEISEIENLLNDFINNWNSHGSPVKGFSKLFYGRFIIFMADETHIKVGGCSTDSFVRFVKNIEIDFKVTLFDRLMLAFLLNEKISLIPLSRVNDSLEKNSITPDTLYFNNTILTKKDLLSHWIIPVKDSWLAARIPPPNTITREH